MQDSFLSLYPKLMQDGQAGADVRQSGHTRISGLWLAHGDEPLLTQWLTDAMRPIWQHDGQEVKRLELVSSKSWQDALAELNSLSLFANATALIVTGNHKPDKTTLAEIESLAQTESENCLLWLLPKQDKRAQNGKWFAPFAKYGQVVDCHLYNEQQRQQLLQQQAQRFGLMLSAEAWQLLLSHTEHHLLSAYQTLWRLSYLFAPQLTELMSGLDETTGLTLGVDDLQAALVSESQFSVFDLSDAMLAGNTAQVVKILDQLKSTDEPESLVLWVIAKDMRLLAQLLDGQSPQSIGIWRSKEGLYWQASRRQSPDSVAEFAALIFQCDQAIKGIVRQPVWELLYQAAFMVCGQRLFASASV